MSTKMNPEVKAAWTQALRSGEYIQGVGHLVEDGKYCCLGVLCDLAVKAGIVTEQGGHFTTVTQDDGSYDEDNCYLPRSVQTWAGLNSRNPEVTLNGLNRPLAALNDSRGVDFQGIADLIENRL